MDDKDKEQRLKDFYAQKLDDERQGYADFYFKDDARELKKVIYNVFGKERSWITDWDYYYVLATDIFVNEVLPNYDSSKGNFKSWLNNCMARKLKTGQTATNRQKNTPYLQGKNGVIRDEKDNPIRASVVSFDAPIDEDENSETIGDTVKTTETVELSERVDNYFEVLSETQKEIAKLIMLRYSPNDICEHLGITKKEYNKSIKDMQIYDKKMLLKREEVSIRIEEEKPMNNQNVSTMEKTKNTSYSIASISKKLRTYQIRDNHVLQRSSGQWSLLSKSELVSDVLQGNSLTPVIISEEIKNGVVMHWLIDGKQRCTNLDDYLNDGFKISKNVQRYEIPYQVAVKDENGTPQFDRDGFAIVESRTFDIRNKKFSQLPEELQDRFKDYQVSVMLNLNCTKKDIAYDISRFNRSKPMSKSQNGWTGLDEDFAITVDNILKMEFFKIDCANTSYTKSNYTSGDMRRVIVEGIILSQFPDAYNSELRTMCNFLNEEANDTVFADFYLLIERLSSIITPDVTKMFTTKDSALWISVFSKLTEMGIDDEKFVDFGAKYITEMERIKEVVKENGTFESDFIDWDTYKALVNSDTKNKVALQNKIDIICGLVKDYLHIEEAEEISDEEFIADMTEMDVEEVTELMDLCNETLDDLLTGTIVDGNKLLDEENRQSLLALVMYGLNAIKQTTLESWFKEYIVENPNYIRNQKQNYLHMRNDLNKFCAVG